MPTGKAYSVYIVKCSDGSYYTGFSSNVAHRVEQHNTSTMGAKYTRSRRPVRLVWSSAPFTTVSAAIREEMRIKSLTHEQKEILVESAIV